MKLRATFYDDNERPERFTVDITLNEMALLYAFVGNVSPLAVTNASGNVEWGNTLYDLGDAVSQIGARHFEDGWDSVSPSLRPIRLGPTKEPTP